MFSVSNLDFNPGRETFLGQSQQMPLTVDPTSDLFSGAGQLTFSFVAGYATGYALRFILKAALFFGGIVLLALFLLQYEHITTVDWSVIQQHFDTLLNSNTTYGKAVADSTAHNLPSAAAFLGGLVLGFRK